MKPHRAYRFWALLLSACLVASCAQAGPTVPVPSQPVPTATLSPLPSTTPLAPTQTHPPALTVTSTPPAPLGLLPQGARLRLSKGQMHWFRLSPDGSTLYIASDAVLCSYRVAGAVENWCARLGVETDSRLGGFDLNPRGDTLAGITQGITSAVIFWDARSGAEVGRAELPGSYLSSLSWSPDSRSLAVAAQDSSASAIQIIDGESYRLQGSIAAGAFVLSALAWSPRGDEIAAGDEVGQVGLWQVDTGKPVFERKVFPDGFQVTDLAWAPDGASLLSSSFFNSCYENCSPTYDGIILQLDSGSGEALRQIRTGQAVQALALNPDGNRIAALLNWQEIGLFDLNKGERLPAKISAPAAAGVRWMPDGKNLLSTSGDNTLVVWDPTLAEPEQQALGGFGRYAAAAWSPDSSQLAATSPQGGIQIWDMRTGTAFPAFGLGDFNTLLAWSPDGSRLASTDQKNLYIWNASSRHLVKQLPGTGIDLAWSPDGRLFAARDHGTLVLRDAQTWTAVQTIPGLFKDVSMAWSPDGTRIASAGTGVSIFEVASGKLLARWGENTAISGDDVHWSPDGSRLAVSDGNTLALLDPRSGKVLERLDNGGQGVIASAFSPNGKILALGYRSIVLRELETGKTLLSLGGFAGNLERLSFSPDGKTLASVLNDGSILLWDIAALSASVGFSTGHVDVTPVPNQAGLTIEENQMVGEPSLDPLTFQPLHGTLQEVMNRHASQKQPNYPVPSDIIDGSDVLYPFNGGREYQAIVSYANGNAAQATLELKHGDQVVFRKEGLVFVTTALAQALWVDGSHWTLEIAALTSLQSSITGQVYQDGRSLNDQYGYQEMFNYRLLNGKPFYFYQKAGVIHLSYDSQDLPLVYDAVPHYGCCSAAEMNPAAGPNWLTFEGRRGTTWYYVQIGRY